MALKGFVGGISVLVPAGAVLLVSAVMLLTSAPPAEAHDTCSLQPRDPSVACLKVYHSRLDVCDRDMDGHKAWARVRYSGGGSISFYDANGANPGCSQYNPGAWGVYVSYNVCVQYEGCGLPRYRPGWGSRVW